MTAHACVLHFSVSVQLDDEVGGILSRASTPEGALAAAAADMCFSDEDRSLFSEAARSLVKSLVARCINVFTNIANGKYQRGKN